LFVYEMPPSAVDLMLLLSLQKHESHVVRTLTDVAVTVSLNLFNIFNDTVIIIIDKTELF
jgi:hypothetical protein